MIEKASGPEEPEEKQEETECEETAVTEAKSAVPKGDSAPHPELSGEPVMTM